jgi:alcohol dehydrogenase, propanol-preferring
MRAMVLERPGSGLALRELPVPEPAADQVLIAVEACGVCRTDLHLLDAELPDIGYPLVPGHQVVGTVVASRAAALPLGKRVGVPWLGATCGQCRYCRSERENLCDAAGFTGYTLPGGFADYLAADARYCFELDRETPAERLAPLLCAGLIGYRALKMCGDAERVGLYGFGAAAHLLAQVLAFQRRPFYAFTRPGDRAAQQAALALGAGWAGGSDQSPPEKLDAAVIFAPLGELVPRSLAELVKGGVVVCAGIHMSDIPAFPYTLLWGERRIRSVANLTRADGEEFLSLASRIPIRTVVHEYPLEAAAQALEDLRRGLFTGSAVLRVAGPGG